MPGQPNLPDAALPADPEARIHEIVGDLAAEMRLPPSHAGARAGKLRRDLAAAIAALRRVAVAPGAMPADGLRNMRDWLESWPRVDALLAAQFPPRARPLFPPPPDASGALAAQGRMADAAAGLFHQVLSRATQDPELERAGLYGDLSLAQSVFLANLQAACRLLCALGRSEGRRFLDVGCGSGTKLLTAAPCFDSVAGIELDPGYAARARQLIGRAPVGNVSVEIADARDFGAYDAYDVIHLFRPLRQPQALAALEDRIVARARPGCLLIAPYAQFAHRAEALGCARIGGALHVVGMTAEEAKRLGREAEFYGPAIGGDGPTLPEIWAPLVEASRRRGFAP